MGFKSGSSASLKEIEAEQKKIIEKLESQEKEDDVKSSSQRDFDRENSSNFNNNNGSPENHNKNDTGSRGFSRYSKSSSTLADDNEINLANQKKKIHKKQEELFEAHKRKFLIDNRRLFKERPDGLPPFVGELMDKLIEAGDLDKNKIETYRQYILREPVVSEKKLKERYLKMVDDVRKKGKESLDYWIEQNPDHWVYMLDEDGVVSHKTIPKNENFEGLGLLHGAYIFVVDSENTPFNHPSELFKWNDNANEKDVEDVFQVVEKNTTSSLQVNNETDVSVIGTSEISSQKNERTSNLEVKEEGKKRRTLKSL